MSKSHDEGGELVDEEEERERERERERGGDGGGVCSVVIVPGFSTQRKTGGFYGFLTLRNPVF